MIPTLPPRPAAPVRRFPSFLAHPCRPFNLSRPLPAPAVLLFSLAFAPSAWSSGFSPFRVALNGRAFDWREPARADFMDCPDTKGPCRALAVPRVMADEKVVLPRNRPLESLRFLTLKGVRAQGGDPLLTVALYAAAGGDSIYADLNNDEDLGNDGPARFWPKGDSCTEVDRTGGGLAPMTLCRTGAPGGDWEKKCEGMKRSIPWALCGEPPIGIRLKDLTLGRFARDGFDRAIGLCDADGDGKIRLDRGDRLVVDWDGNGRPGKSLEDEGIAAPAGGGPLRFSLDSSSYEVVAADERGAWLDLRRLAAFDPAAEGSKAVEGRMAPDIRFINMDGDTMRISDFRGKKVMLHFWSTLCKPCLDNMDRIRAFQKGFGGKNWQVISLTTDTDLSQVQQAVLKRHMDWMVGMAGPDARRYYASHPLPLTVKIDERGVLEKKGVSLGARSF